MNWDYMGMNKVKPKETESERYARGIAEQDAAVDKAAAELEAKREEHIAACLSEHALDAAAYRFECERFADFLALRITRLSKRTPSVINPDQNKVGPVLTEKRINLGLVTSIDLVPGSPPAAEGRVWYSVAFRNLTSGSVYYSSPVGTTPDGYEMVAAPNLWMPSAGERRSYDEPVQNDNSYGQGNAGGAGGGSGWGGYSNSAYKATPYPVAAEDDTIVLRGLYSTIRAPFGLGQMVVDKIMAAIATKGAS